MPVRQQARALRQSVLTACPMVMRQFRYFRYRAYEGAEAMAGTHIQAVGVSAQTAGTPNSRRQPRPVTLSWWFILWIVCYSSEY